MSTPGEIASKRGRARAARPFVVLSALAAAAALLTPAVALAIPQPILAGTNPASPGASLTPRIQGQLEGGETKAIEFAVGFEEPITMEIEPTNTVRIYKTSNCTGTVAGEGTVEELSEDGIQVTVTADSTTTFYANQSDGLGDTSPCSVQGTTYRQVSSAPEPPTLDSVLPASPANYNFPHLRGNADAEATVSIYATGNCTGPVVGSGSGAAFATTGVQVSVADNSETTFSAKASMAGFFSTCSAHSIVYREETPPPPATGEGGSGGGGSTGGGTSAPAGPPPSPPRLRMVPSGSANNNAPVVTGSAPGASTVRIFSGAGCSGTVLAKVPAAQFASSGVAVQVPDNSTSVFSGGSVSGGGESLCSASVVYVEDSSAPHTRITMGPGAKTAKRKAVFRFTDTTGNLPGTTFACKVDKGKWKPCSSPLKLGHLRPRRYTIAVKATDEAGNAESKGVKRQFKVIRHP